VRSFIAIDLPESLRRSLAEKSEMLSANIAPRAIRWVRPEGIHLTLKFLGDVDPAGMEKARQAISETVPHFSPFTFSVEGLGCFPNARRPRVIWVGVHEESGELAALVEALERAFADHGFERENRGFHPHLTLGRVRRGVSKADYHIIRETLARTGRLSLGDVHVREVLLYRSELKPSGAVYTRLLAAKLEGGG
jgi:2'-5' RNA ligase